VHRADSPQSPLSMRSVMRGQTALQECWRTAQRWLNSISKPMKSGQKLSPSHRERAGSAIVSHGPAAAHSRPTSIYNAMTSKLSGKGGSELRHSAVAFGLALSLSWKEVMNKRHDLYLITSLWVVALLCIYSQYQSIDVTYHIQNT
jgi:hypothetical protein